MNFKEKLIDKSLVYPAATLFAPTSGSLSPLTLRLGTVFVQHLRQKNVKKLQK